MPNVFRFIVNASRQLSSQISGTGSGASGIKNAATSKVFNISRDPWLAVDSIPWCVGEDVLIQIKLEFFYIVAEIAYALPTILIVKLYHCR